MGTKEFDEEGRLIGGEYDDFWLLNVYFPNGGEVLTVWNSSFGITKHSWPFARGCGKASRSFSAEM
jgi:exonuclease III